MDLRCSYCALEAFYICQCLSKMCENHIIYHKQECIQFISNRIELLKSWIFKNYGIMFESCASFFKNLYVTNDNKFLITVEEDDTISIWNILEKRKETVLQGFKISDYSISISLNNKYVVFSSRNNKIGVWNLQEKYEVTLQGHYSCVLAVAITHDNKYLLSGGGYLTAESDHSIELILKVI